MVSLPVFSHPPIDIHSHFNHGSPFDCPGTPVHRRDLAFLKQAYDHIGVCAVGMSTFASVLEHTECILEENRYLQELTRKTDWMYQWVVIDPRQPDTYRQAEEILKEEKTLGIKIHPAYHGYDMEAYADELFAFAAEHRTFLLMHPAKIDKMPFYANRYPEMKLIIAHFGSVDHVNAVANAKYGNIFVDTSGGASNLNNILKYAVEQVGSEKIFFGTDTYSCPFQFGRIALADLPLKDKENILWKNAMVHFPKAFKE